MCERVRVARTVWLALPLLLGMETPLSSSLPHDPGTRLSPNLVAWSVSSGIPDLDELLGGGLPQHSVVVVEQPGTAGLDWAGRLVLHWLSQGLAVQQRCLSVVDLLSGQRASSVTPSGVREAAALEAAGATSGSSGLGSGASVPPDPDDPLRRLVPWSASFLANTEASVASLPTAAEPSSPAAPPAPGTVPGPGMTIAWQYARYDRAGPSSDPHGGYVCTAHQAALSQQRRQRAELDRGTYVCRSDGGRPFTPTEWTILCRARRSASLLLPGGPTHVATPRPDQLSLIKSRAYPCGAGSVWQTVWWWLLAQLTRTSRQRTASRPVEFGGRNAAPHPLRSFRRNPRRRTTQPPRSGAYPCATTRVGMVLGTNSDLDGEGCCGIGPGTGYAWLLSCVRALVDAGAAGRLPAACVVVAAVPTILFADAPGLLAAVEAQADLVLRFHHPTGPLSAEGLGGSRTWRAGAQEVQLTIPHARGQLLTQLKPVLAPARVLRPTSPTFIVRAGRRHWHVTRQRLPALMEAAAPPSPPHSATTPTPPTSEW